MARLKLPALPRKLSRLPRVGQITNPFKAGTKTTGKRVKRALGAHTAALAVNNIPGKAVAAGALGAKLGGPAGAAAAFGSAEAASVAISALLARSIARRGRAAKYLSRRGKRKTGVYKAGAAMLDLRDAIEKAGLITPGKRPLLHRVGFLLSTGSNERNYKVGRYLEGRKRGKAIPGTKRPRRGKYTGVYATGINKSESGMDAIDLLYTEIEKAVRFRGQSMSSAQRRHVALGTGGGKAVWRERGRDNFMRGGRRGRKASVAGHTARTTPGAKQRAIASRLGIRKSEDKMTDATDELYTAIEKAKGLMPHGGSGRLQRVFARRADERKLSGKGKTYAFRDGYLSTRRKGGVTGQGLRDHPNGGKAYRSMTRTKRPGSYKR